MISEYRVERLKEVLAEKKRQGYNSYASIERKFRVSASYLSQLINGVVPLGETAARNIEGKLGLPPYFLDNDFLAAHQQESLTSKHLSVALVNTHLTIGINDDDIMSAVHFNATAGISGFMLIRRHLSSIGMKFSDNYQSETNQANCARYLIDGAVGFLNDESSLIRDIQTIFIDDDGIKHDFTVRLSKIAV